MAVGLVNAVFGVFMVVSLGVLVGVYGWNLSQDLVELWHDYREWRFYHRPRKVSIIHFFDDNGEHLECLAVNETVFPNRYYTHPGLGNFLVTQVIDNTAYAYQD